ncbi:MAG: murein biosynthesis integral membrane protein MurJ [Parcubacteria group bacterium]|jgi:putative peptidoglycan lipid II flippase
MIKKLVNNKILNSKPTESITAAAFIIAVSGFASRFLGLFRDRILASQFGAGDTLDAYYAAFRIPDLLYNLLILGALSAAFIPVFTGLISNKKEEEGWELVSGILNIMVFVLIIVAAILAIFAPFIVHLITPGFSGEKMELTIMLTRIMFLSPVLLGISAIFGGVLVSLKKFLIYSIAPIMYNIGIIIGALFFVKLMGPKGLAVGVILGALLHMLIQYPAVKFSGFKFKPILFGAFRNENVRKIIRLMIPRTMGIAVSQINLLVITIFASTLASGSLAVFNFANNIQSFPLGLFGVSFAVAVFPTLSATYAKGLHDEFIKNFSQTFRRILFFIIPLSVLILLLRAQLVRVILGGGQFNWEDTVMTFETLGFLTVSLFAQCLIPLLARAFYAIHNTKIPFYIALVSEAVNIILVILLIKNYAVSGLAIAFSAASILNMVLLFVILRKKLGGLDGKNIFSSTSKILLASTIAGLITQIMKYAIDRIANIDTFLGIFFQLIISGGLGIIVFVFMSWVFKTPEFFHFKNSIVKRFYRTKGTINEITEETDGM